MKQVKKTAEIIDLLRASFGAEVDVEDLAVFEVTAFNNLPIRKKHPLYEGAIAQDSLLRAMVARINEESAPLQVMHDGSELPSGRVFNAQLVGQEVRALMALSNKTQTKLISDIDQGVIDQVSVNVLPEQILCSECGWDFLGEDSGFDNVYLGECANGHVLRQDGVHAKLHGLGHLAEISLVNQGGAQNARIQTRDKQIYGQPVFQRLAASGHSPAMLLASLTPSVPQERSNNMDLTQLTASLTDVKAKNLHLEAQLEAANTSIATSTETIVTLTANLEAAQARVAELEAKPEPEAPAAVLSFLTDLCKRSMIALGDQTPTVPTEVADVIAKITEAQAKLSALIPSGGAALSATQDDDQPMVGGASAAFRTPGTKR